MASILTRRLIWFTACCLLPAGRSLQLESLSFLTGAAARNNRHLASETVLKPRIYIYVRRILVCPMRQSCDPCPFMHACMRLPVSCNRHIRPDHNLAISTSPDQDMPEQYRNFTEFGDVSDSFYVRTGCCWGATLFSFPLYCSDSSLLSRAPQPTLTYDPLALRCPSSPSEGAGSTISPAAPG